MILNVYESLVVHNNRGEIDGSISDIQIFRHDITRLILFDVYYVIKCPVIDYINCHVGPINTVQLLQLFCHGPEDKSCDINNQVKLFKEYITTIEKLMLLTKC